VDVLAYRVEGDSLSLNMGGVQLQLTRAGAGKASKAGKAVPQPEPREMAMMEPPKPRPAANDSLSQLLVSSSWCSFSYSKTSGVTRQSKVRFLPNGTWSSGSQAETYASGSAGTYASQSNGGSGGQWAVKGGRLYMSTPPESPSLEPVEPFSVTKNSSGYPIINAMGQEYSQCR
jgi:hypothetical protein